MKKSVTKFMNIEFPFVISRADTGFWPGGQVL